MTLLYGKFSRYPFIIFELCYLWMLLSLFYFELRFCVYCYYTVIYINIFSFVFVLCLFIIILQIIKCIQCLRKYMHISNRKQNNVRLYFCLFLRLKLLENTEPIGLQSSGNNTYWSCGGFKLFSWGMGHPHTLVTQEGEFIITSWGCFSLLLSQKTN